MYANVLSGVKQGVMTKHTVPRFPDTMAEIQRLLGVSPTVVRAYTCQAATGNFADVGGVTDLIQQNSPVFRTPIKGIQEYGGGTRSTSSNNGWAQTDAAARPFAASFLLMYYGNYTGGGGSSPNVGFGFIDSSDGVEILLINPQDSTENQWVWRCNDGTNSKGGATGTTDPRDTVARGTAILYDAAAGTITSKTTGTVPISAAMGAWVGIGASCTTTSILIGYWPGTPGSDLNIRYGLLAHGAQLDNQGVNLDAVVRRFGWQ